MIFQLFTRYLAMPYGDVLPTVGLFEVDPLPTCLPCFAILKFTKRAAQGGGGSESTIPGEPAVCLSCAGTRSLSGMGHQEEG